MKLKIFLLFILLTSFQVGKSEILKLGQSAPFEAPQKGFARLFALDNGNASYVKYFKGELDFRLYDKGYKLITSKKVMLPEGGSINKSSVLKLFTIKNQVNVFVQGNLNRSWTLFQISIDGSTGEVSENKIVRKLDKVSDGKAFAKGYSRQVEPKYYLSKSDYSDYYVIGVHDSYNKDKKQSLFVMLCNGQSKVIDSSYVPYPIEGYDFMRLRDLIVGPDQSVYATIYSMQKANAMGIGDEKFALHLAKLKDNKVDFLRINMPVGLYPEKSMSRYNKATNQIIFFNRIRVSKKMLDNGKDKRSGNTFYVDQLLFYDATSNKIVKSIGLDLKDFEVNRKKLYGAKLIKKKPFSVVPQNMIIDEEGNFSVIIESIVTKASQQSCFKLVDDIAVLHYDKNGEFLSSQIVVKRHVAACGYSDDHKYYALIKSLSFNAFYHHRYTSFKACPLVRADDHLLSFAYINGKTQKYLMVNDFISNQKIVANGLKGKLKKMRRPTKATAYYVGLGGMEFVPKSEPLFTETEGEIGFFLASDYNKITDRFVVLKREKDKLRVVWMQPD